MRDFFILDVEVLLIISRTIQMFNSCQQKNNLFSSSEI